jgi:DTW domain-containing protein YfiP
VARDWAPAAGASQASPADLNADCPRCLKPQALCMSEAIAPIDNKVSLLMILQHPQDFFCRSDCRKLHSEQHTPAAARGLVFATRTS